MRDFKWSDHEKKLSRRVFDAALQRELAEVVREFKSKAAALTTIDQMWAVEDDLRSKRREFEIKYDYRRSQLLFVFARPLHEGRINEATSQNCLRTSWMCCA